MTMMTIMGMGMDMEAIMRIKVMGMRIKVNLMTTTHC